MAAKIQCSSKSFFMFLLLMSFCGIIILHQQHFFQVPFSSLAHHFHNFWNRPHNNPNLRWTVSMSDPPAGTTIVDNRSDLNTVHNVLYHEAYPQNYRFLIDDSEKCERENPFLVLMVSVAPQELKARNAIRSTWGNESLVQGKNISVVFMLGLYGGTAIKNIQEKLKTESERHHDLIQSSFLDSYRNLTIKTMVIMDWLATRCPQASYAMKIDSDMFLNVENLMSMLLAPGMPRESYITGMVMSNRPVVRNANSKWYVSKENYPDDHYPTYLLGMGYVFSKDLPERLVRVSKFIRPFPIEDAYIGTCLKELGVSPSTPPEPSRFKAYHSEPFDRKRFDHVITTILGSPEQLMAYWQNLKNSQ